MAVFALVVTLIVANVVVWAWFIEEEDSMVPSVLAPVISFMTIPIIVAYTTGGFSFNG